MCASLHDNCFHCLQAMNLPSFAPTINVQSKQETQSLRGKYVRYVIAVCVCRVYVHLSYGLLYTYMYVSLMCYVCVFSMTLLVGLLTVLHVVWVLSYTDHLAHQKYLLSVLVDIG